MDMGLGYSCFNNRHGYLVGAVWLCASADLSVADRPSGFARNTIRASKLVACLVPGTRKISRGGRAGQLSL